MIFIEDMIMKHASKDIMNKMARCIMSLYSYDEDPDNISTAKCVLRQEPAAYCSGSVNYDCSVSG